MPDVFNKFPSDLSTPSIRDKLMKVCRASERSSLNPEHSRVAAWRMEVRWVTVNRHRHGFRLCCSVHENISIPVVVAPGAAVASESRNKRPVTNAHNHPEQRLAQSSHGYLCTFCIHRHDRYVSSSPRGRSFRHRHVEKVESHHSERPAGVSRNHRSQQSTKQNYLTCCADSQNLHPTVGSHLSPPHPCPPPPPPLPKLKPPLQER